MQNFNHKKRPKQLFIFTTGSLIRWYTVPEFLPHCGKRDNRFSVSVKNITIFCLALLKINKKFNHIYKRKFCRKSHIKRLTYRCKIYQEKFALTVVIFC